MMYFSKRPANDSRNTRLCVQIVSFFCCGDEKVRAQLSFGRQRTSADGRTGPKLQDIVGELAIEESHAILAGDLVFCSIAEVKEHGMRF